MNARRVTMAGCALILLLGTGAALAQSCVSSIPDPAPDARYLMKSDGTVVDRDTGLMWMRCAVGQAWDATQKTCTGTAKTFTWKAALAEVQAVNSASYAGYQDWRLPNLRELTSLVRYACPDPAINVKAFPATPGETFWTSTPVASSYGLGWGVDFTTGQAYFQAYGNAFPIRLVRAGAFAY